MDDTSANNNNSNSGGGPSKTHMRWIQCVFSLGLCCFPVLSDSLFRLSGFVFVWIPQMQQQKPKQQQKQQQQQSPQPLMLQWKKVKLYLFVCFTLHCSALRISRSWVSVMHKHKPTTQTFDTTPIYRMQTRWSISHTFNIYSPFFCSFTVCTVQQTQYTHFPLFTWCSTKSRPDIFDVKCCYRSWWLFFQFFIIILVSF